MTTSESQPELPSARAEAQRQARQPVPCLIFLATCLVIFAAVTLVLLRGNSPEVAGEQASATREAVQLATSQAERRATARTSRATTTAVARRTATAFAHETQVASHQTSTAATAAAEATAKAPPTLTAQARALATAVAESQATVQVLDGQATPRYGPTGGTLEQVEGEGGPCVAAGVQLRNFVAEATFHNPQAGGLVAGGAWDYGLVFSNRGEDAEYRAIIDSEAKWTFNLHSPGYDISISDTTNLLDLSDRGSNTLRLYVTEDTAQLYANGRYISTFDLNMLGLGQSEQATHDVSVCAGIREGYSAVGRVTAYEGFRVWSLP